MTTIIGVTHTHDYRYDLGGRLREVKIDVTGATYAGDGERSSCCPQRDGP